MSLIDTKGRSVAPVQQAGASIFQSTGAKTIFYGNNGGGRDTYISTNNGGFSITNEPKKAAEIGSFVFQKKAPRSFRPIIHSKKIQYHSDGTGRDSYIQTSHGGLAVTYSPGTQNKTFFNTLRSYQRIEHSPIPRDKSGSPSPQDTLRASQGFYSVKYQQQMKMFKSYQDFQTKRLAQPKYAKSPKNKRYGDELDAVSPMKAAGSSITKQLAQLSKEQ